LLLQSAGGAESKALLNIKLTVAHSPVNQFLGVVTSDASGTDTSGIVASIAGDIHFKSTHGTWDLTVS
jgi:hypothetical protein